MNTDKIFAEQLANEYAPKDTSKVVALRKLDGAVILIAVSMLLHSRKRKEMKPLESLGE